MHWSLYLRFCMSRVDGEQDGGDDHDHKDDDGGQNLNCKKSEHETRSWIDDILLSFSEEKTQSSPLKRPLVIFVKGNSQTDSFQCYI